MRLLPYSIVKFYKCDYSKGGITIQQEKKYYNQNDIANEIRNRIDCSSIDVLRVLNSLGDVVKDKFSDSDEYVELKIFPGLKVTSRYIPLEQSKSNLNLKNNSILSITSVFTDDFRKKVRELHNNLE